MKISIHLNQEHKSTTFSNHSQSSNPLVLFWDAHCAKLHSRKITTTYTFSGHPNNRESTCKMGRTCRLHWHSHGSLSDPIMWPYKELMSHNCSSLSKAHPKRIIACYTQTWVIQWSSHCCSGGQICLHEPYLVRRHFIKNMSLPTIEYSKLSTGWWCTLPAVVHKKKGREKPGR
jgi:hypothetical protein